MSGYLVAIIDDGRVVAGPGVFPTLALGLGVGDQRFLLSFSRRKLIVALSPGSPF